MKRNKLGDKATVKSSPKQKREIMTEKDNQEGGLKTLGDKAAAAAATAPTWKSWGTRQRQPRAKS